MKLPLAAYAGLPEKAPRGRSFRVTHYSTVRHTEGIAPLATRVGRFKTLPEAIADAEKVDPRLNPQIILVEADT